MKIKIECPNCNEILEIELDDKTFEVISVIEAEESIEVSSDILNELGIEFG